MTASQKPKTPSMTMKVRRGVPSQDIDLFCKRASRITVSQVVDNVTVREQLLTEGEARRTRFTIDITLYPKHEYQEEYDLEPEEILAAFGVQFPLTLKKEMLNEMKKLDADLKSQMAQLGQGKKVKERNGESNDDEEGETSKKKKDDEEGSEMGDGDADDAKHARQRKQQATYDSDEEDETEEVGAYDDAAIEAEYASENEATDGAPVKKTKSSFKSQVGRVSDLFQRHLQHCISFSFDESKCSFVLEVSSLS